MCHGVVELENGLSGKGLKPERLGTGECREVGIDAAVFFDRTDITGADYRVGGWQVGAWFLVEEMVVFSHGSSEQSVVQAAGFCTCAVEGDEHGATTYLAIVVDLTRALGEGRHGHLKGFKACRASDGSCFHLGIL